jgi:hypothetical protein
MANEKTIPLFKVGDRVQLLPSPLQGRIVELRGPLGPGGAQIYRVRIHYKPKMRRPSYIEVREDQLQVIPAYTY